MKQEQAEKENRDFKVFVKEWKESHPYAALEFDEGKSKMMIAWAWKELSQIKEQ